MNICERRGTKSALSLLNDMGQPLTVERRKNVSEIKMSAPYIHLMMHENTAHIPLSTVHVRHFVRINDSFQVEVPSTVCTCNVSAEVDGE